MMKLYVILITGICLVVLPGLLNGCSLSGRNKATPPAQRPATRVWKTDEIKPNHLALAEQLVQDKFYDVAQVQLIHARKFQRLKTAEQVRTYDLSGVCARETGDFNSAETWLKKGLSLDRKNASIYNNLGILYAMEEHFEKAAKALEKAVSYNPGRADFTNNLGWVTMARKDYAGAQIYFKKSLALDPGNATAVNNLALSLGMQNKDTQAFDLLRRHQSPEDARHNMEYIRTRREETGRTWERPFKVQARKPLAPDNDNAATGLPGDGANEVYKNYQDALKKSE
nr:tetratricopeptide repeat protein [uncultured Desulfobacter sp.]